MIAPLATPEKTALTPVATRASAVIARNVDGLYLDTFAAQRASAPALEVDTVKNLTIQTEFFAKPNWRVETKVYLGGALKKDWIVNP